MNYKSGVIRCFQIKGVQESLRQLALIVCLGLSLSSCSGSPTAPVALPVTAEVTLQSVYPKGLIGTIAFECLFEHWEICSVELSKKTFHRLTNSSFDNMQPRLSPDGKWVAFITLVKKDVTTVNVVASDGGAINEVISNGAINEQVNWSPDGKLLAYASKQPGVYSINTVDVVTREKREIVAATSLESYPVWSPKGKSLALVSAQDGAPNIYLLSLDDPQPTKNMRRISSALPGAEAFAPVWSSDGQWIAYTFTENTSTSVMAVNLADSKTTRVSGDTLIAFSPVWIPGAHQLVFVVGGVGNEDIAIMNVDGTGYRDISQMQGREWMPAISTDGQYVFFVGAFRNDSQVYATTIDGTSRWTITNDKSVKSSLVWAAEP